MSAPVLRFALLGLAVLGACATPPDHQALRDDLEDASTLIARSELASAEKLLESSLVEPADDDARLQRFHAAVLLVRTHVGAAFGSPYLPSARPPTGAEWALDAGPATPKPSPVAHCVAALRWAELAREWYAGLGPHDPARAKQLLPAALDGVAPRDALAYAQLAALACYARLRFDDRVEEVFSGMQALADFERCEAVLAATRVEDALRPWIYYGGFERWVDDDEPRAFKFAVRALETATQTRALGERERARLADWLVDGSRFVFRCPTCDTLAEPALFACSVCRRPTLEFEPEPRQIANR